MYGFMLFGIGGLTALMIAANGMLSQGIGPVYALVFIHAADLLPSIIASGAEKRMDTRESCGAMAAAPQVASPGMTEGEPRQRERL